MTSANTERVRGVVFDLDGTLYRLRWPKLRMALALRTSLRPLRHLGKARAALRSRSFGDAEKFKAALYDAVAERAGILPEQAAHWYETRFMPAFIALSAKHGRVRPGLLSLLKTLRENGTRIAVVSDYGQVADRLSALGIPPDLFDELVAVDQVGRLKPCAEPLKMLCKKWKIEAARITVVGDRDDLDGASARAAGMPFVGIIDNVHLIEKRNGFICWSEVTKLLRAKTAPAT